MIRNKLRIPLECGTLCSVPHSNGDYMITFKPRKTGKAATHKNGRRTAYQSTNMNFRLPTTLDSAIREIAKKEGISRGAVVVAILSHYCEQRKGTSDSE